MVTTLLAAAGHGEAEESDRAWSASIGIGSDYTFRGVSQTMGNSALQTSFDLDLSSGVYAYAWASNVDFVPDGEPDDGASHEIDLALGYATDIGNDWSIDLALIRYVFPGTISDVNYDYNEFAASVWYRETYGATVAFSGDVDGTGANSVFYKLATNFALSSDTTVDIAYGYYDLSGAYGAAYSYLETALARQLGNTSITLAYNDTHRSANAIFDDRVTGPRLILTLQIDW